MDKRGPQWDKALGYGIVMYLQPEVQISMRAKTMEDLRQWQDWIIAKWEEDFFSVDVDFPGPSVQQDPPEVNEVGMWVLEGKTWRFAGPECPTCGHELEFSRADPLDGWCVPCQKYRSQGTPKLPEQDPPEAT